MSDDTSKSNMKLINQARDEMMAMRIEGDTFLDQHDDANQLVISSRRVRRELAEREQRAQLEALPDKGLIQ